MASKHRKRESPQKKWTAEENQKILNFLMEHRDLEKPTAQIYYKKMIQKYEFDVPWPLLKCKVRNFRTSFNKANAWKRTCGISLDEPDGYLVYEEKIHKMCPYYESLAELFGYKEDEEDIPESCKLPKFEENNFSSEFADVNGFLTVGSASLQSLPISDEGNLSLSASVDASLQSLAQNDETLTGIPRTRLATMFTTNATRKRKENSDIKELIEIEKRRNNFLEKRLELEQVKLDLEKQKIEIDKLKLEKDYELKKMELQQKEKLAIMEMKLKYKQN